MTVAHLSFGCHNLTGGSSWSRSHRLIRCALDLGIRRFDVAPSYGLGTAEATLSRALGPRRGDPDIEITTKFGIAPPRFGKLVALFREPYRLLRSRHSRSGIRRPLPSTSSFDQLSQPGSFTGTAREAVEASLRALRIDCVGGFLSHERLCDKLADNFAGDMLDLKRRGLVKRVGCSGNIANVAHMCSRGNGVAQIIQTHWRHLSMVDDAVELRLFNIGGLARQIASIPGLEHAGSDLADAVPSSLGLDLSGAMLAAAVVWLRTSYPGAILIVNASSETRLSALVLATLEPGLDRWVANHRSLFRDLVEMP